MGDAVKRDNAEIGARLRQLREELGVPRARIALDMGMESENVRHYESGRNTIKVPDLPILAGSLGVSMDYLVRRLFGEEPAREPTSWSPLIANPIPCMREYASALIRPPMTMVVAGV